MNDHHQIFARPPGWRILQLRRRSLWLLLLGTAMPIFLSALIGCSAKFPPPLVIEPTYSYERDGQSEKDQQLAQSEKEAAADM